MQDRNDIKFKGSLGSPPKIKWQLFSRGSETCLLPTLPLHSLVSQQRLHFQALLPLLVGGEGAGPQEMRDQVETLKMPVLPSAPGASLWSPQFGERGSNPAPLPLDSCLIPTKPPRSLAA